MAAAPIHDPSRTSFYVDDAWYARLVAGFTGWQSDDLLHDDPLLCSRVGALLFREARLLDQGRYEDWLSLLTPECLYWVPGSTDGGDPRQEVAMCFEDRRRLEDRVYRLRTGYAWSQIPPSRTARIVGNVEVFRTSGDDVVMARSTFLLTEIRAGQSRTLAGWYAHRIEVSAAVARIAVKQVNLLECDRNLWYPSGVL